MEKKKTWILKALAFTAIAAFLSFHPTSVTTTTAATSSNQALPAQPRPGTIKVCSGDQTFILNKYNELLEQGIEAEYSTEIGSDGDWVYCLTY